MKQHGAHVQGAPVHGLITYRPVPPLKPAGHTLDAILRAVSRLRTTGGMHHHGHTPPAGA